MNPHQLPFSDDDEPPPPIASNKRRIKTSRAEKLAWCASLFLFAAVALFLLFPLVAMETRVLLSLACLALGGAFVWAAWRDLM